MSHFLVGRQPIFDSKFNVHGYELLFRGTGPQAMNGDVKTADVLVRAGLDVGLSALVGSKLAFINATRAFVTGDHEVPFPPGQTVIEVLEDVPRDAEVVAGCLRLAESGFTLALDDYVSGEDIDPLLELVSIVKLDVLALSDQELVDAVKHCKYFGVSLVAEKVETREQLRICQDLGFDLYQGYLLSRPEVVEGRALSPSRMTCLRIIEKLCDPDICAGEIEKIVQTDAALSYRFLKVAGAGAARGMFRRLSSVRDAVVLLGDRRIRAWVMLMLMADSHEGSDEQLAIAMTRARMAELMSDEIMPQLTESAFTVGLLSSLDLLLQAPLPEVIGDLSLTVEVEEALLDRAGLLGDVLSDVLAWEVGGEDFHLRSGLSPGEVEQCYLRALAWAGDVCRVCQELDPTG